MFVPINEQGVIYLFSRYHEKLGFERILHMGTRFPDATAIRNGKKVRIELEFLLSGLLSHYIFKDANPHTQKWIKEKQDKNKVYWRLCGRQSSDPTSQHYNTWIKHTGGVAVNKEISKNIEAQHGALIWKSLKPFCDVVICWEADCVIDDPEIEVIELKTILHKLNQPRIN